MHRLTLACAYQRRQAWGQDCQTPAIASGAHVLEWSCDCRRCCLLLWSFSCSIISIHMFRETLNTLVRCIGPSQGHLSTSEAKRSVKQGLIFQFCLHPKCVTLEIPFFPISFSVFIWKDLKKSSCFYYQGFYLERCFQNKSRKKGTFSNMSPKLLQLKTYLKKPCHLCSCDIQKGLCVTTNNLDLILLCSLKAL